MADQPPAPTPALLHERARPDFPAVFRSLATRSTKVDVALLRIRLSGVRIGPAELAGVRRLRLLLAEMDALSLGREAEALLLHPERRRRLRFLLGLLREGRIEIRRSPLGGWCPDFSVFSGAEGPDAGLVGLHWFDRPCLEPGPTLASLHGAGAARTLSARFGELWDGAHDVADAVRGLMEVADLRTPDLPPGAAGRGPEPSSPGTGDSGTTAAATG